MSIKKNIFAPWSKGLGATRRAAMLLLVMMLTATTAWATDKTLSGSESYTAQNGDVLTGSTSGTVTIASGANVTLSDVTITGGIVCAGTAEITLVGTNSVSGATNKAGIEIGGSGTTLTIRGEGSLTANGGYQSAGIGLSRIWNYDSDVASGNIVIEGGTITATGGYWGAGIGIGTVKNTNNDNSTSVQFGNVTIKGGTVTATGGSSGDGMGKGYSYNGPTITIGTVTIYDGIEMVDASSIRDFANVVYMHDETDVTNSKTDYFTITEDGNRRVIVPKDNTDYNITIADGIEHGTLTGAATAKYMENVTITATPDFGYRLSRLVVKDAQNNDVASTGNSFFMPKSNVTVSAVFEQGTHGTTEFAWGYYEHGFVKEATIYDGVTTVNIQNTGQNEYTGTSYHIQKYEGDTYYIFRLDNNEDGQAIPFTGTGEFAQNQNPTQFYVTDDNELGFYDITMTDVGNGKWSVSILKTVGVIDNIPDQTYTGSEITPEPLVMAGSLNLTKGTDYVYSYTNNTNVGTAKVRATFQGTYASLGYVEKEFTILPSTVMVSVTGSGTVTCGDRSATDGTSFGVMSEKGASVALTLAPTDGNAVRSVEYGYTGYTNSNEMTTNGAKLPINGTTATLTVPDDLKDGTGVTVTVTFAPALNGGADEASAVALTDATVTDLGGGWYKVENDISFDHTLNLLADTYLTIAEGKTMSVNTTSGKAIDSEYTLNVSGEGALNITTTEAYKIAVRVGSYVQTGAMVTANGHIGIRCMDNFDEFNVTNDFTFSGGQLTATGSGGDGIWADNDITLSCTNATDFILASSYDGTIKVAEGKALTDGTEASNGMNGYSGTLTNEQTTAIGGKTLHRAVTTSYVEASGTLHENVIAIPLDNTMTTLAAGWYVVNENVDYTGTITLGGNVNLILGDGCTMSVNQTVSNAEALFVSANAPLTIYGQTLGTGTLTVTNSGGFSGIRSSSDITINGGIIETTGSYGIHSYSDITLNGGTITATGTTATGIMAEGTSTRITLGGATVTSSSYSAGSITIVDGMVYTDGTGATYDGELTSDEITAIANKTFAKGMNWTDLNTALTAGGTRTVRLTNNVIRDVVGAITVTGTVTLDLNGYTLDGNSPTCYNPLFFVNDGVSLTITDSQTGGNLCNAGTNPTVSVDGGTLTLAAGTINAQASGVIMWGGNFNMTGGTITGGSSNGVYLNGDNVTFTMSGGTITGNETGVEISHNPSDNKVPTFTVSGNVNITGNTDEDVNMYYDYQSSTLNPIHIGGTLASTARIGVYTDCSVGDNEAKAFTVGLKGRGTRENFNLKTSQAIVLVNLEDGEMAVAKPYTLSVPDNVTVNELTEASSNTYTVGYGDHITLTYGGSVVSDFSAHYTVPNGTITYLGTQDRQGKKIAFTMPGANTTITKDSDKDYTFSGITLKETFDSGSSEGLDAIFDGTSEVIVDIPNPIEVKSVTYDREFKGQTPATVMLPFDYTCIGTEGGKFYEFVGVEKDDIRWVATMKETDPGSNKETTLIANTPYLFMPNGSEGAPANMQFPSISGSVTLNTTGGGNCLASDAEGWVFHGTYSKKLWNEGEAHDYGFAATSGTSADDKSVEAGQFVRLTTGASAKPMRCYLSYVGGPAQARALTRGAAATDEELPSSIIVRLVGSNGETTAIGTIDTKTGEMTFDSEAWYTLDGVRLSGKPSTKGIYINNGRKIVIK